MRPARAPRPLGALTSLLSPTVTSVAGATVPQMGVTSGGWWNLHLVAYLWSFWDGRYVSAWPAPLSAERSVHMRFTRPPLPLVRPNGRPQRPLRALRGVCTDTKAPVQTFLAPGGARGRCQFGRR